MGRSKEDDWFKPIPTSFGGVAHLICLDPMIMVVEDFFNATEVEWVQSVFRADRAKFQDAPIETKGVDMEIRRSKLDAYSYHSSLAVHFRAKLRALFGEEFAKTIPERQMDLPILQHYNPDGFVLYHYDTLLKHTLKGISRQLTALCYLNDVKEDQGGDTDFLLAGVRIHPKAGRLLLWANSSSATRDHGILHDRLSLHAGLKLKGNSKQIMTIWAYTSESPTALDFDLECRLNPHAFSLTVARPNTVASPTRKRKSSETALQNSNGSAKCARTE